MCFEYTEGTEERSYSSSKDSGAMPKRPRVCDVDETKNDDNDCICYIIQAAGQSGPKQTPDGAGFRPEIDYLEVSLNLYFTNVKFSRPFLKDVFHGSFLTAILRSYLQMCSFRNVHFLKTTKFQESGRPMK